MSTRFEQLLAQAELKQAVLVFTAVPPTADIDEARAKLRSDPNLKDIFVTVGGRPQDNVRAGLPTATSPAGLGAWTRGPEKALSDPRAERHSLIRKAISDRPPQT